MPAHPLGLRNPKDLWCLGFMTVHPAVIACHWLRGPSLPLTVLTCILAYGMGCVQHCHGHMPFFRHGFGNRLAEILFTLFRGDGCYAWKATHNANHHRYANHPGDYTLTWRYSAANNLGQFLRYLGHGACAYVRASAAYLASSLSGGRFLGWSWLAQLAGYAGLLAYLLILDAAATVYAVLIPQAFGLLAMIGTGYFQHHHTDENHPYDNSRNFTGRLLNLVTFNHGYHLVHHLHITMHWTDWPKAHAKVSHLIHPELNQESLAFYFLKIFLLQHIDARFATRDFRAGRKSHAGARNRANRARTRKRRFTPHHHPMPVEA